MASEVRVIVADLGKRCRALAFDGADGVPIVIANEGIRRGDLVIRESAFRLFLDQLSGPEEQRN